MDTVLILAGLAVTISCCAFLDARCQRRQDEALKAIQALHPQAPAWVREAMADPEYRQQLRGKGIELLRDRIAKRQAQQDTNRPA